jgi:hypothetical protein
VKYKVRMVVRGDQQVEGESFISSDLYAPVLKAQEAWLILASGELLSLQDRHEPSFSVWQHGGQRGVYQASGLLA